VTLQDELERIAALANAHAQPEERVAAIIAAEATPGRRTYLCAFERDGLPEAEQSWLALDGSGTPLAERAAVREAVSIAALCELAEETAGGGGLDELRAQLVAVRISEQPEGIEEAEAALDELQRVLGSPPAVASPARLDAIGAAVRELELALGGALSPSPFAEALAGATAVVEALVGDVERGYRGPLG
jgi:hypothetical protein